jgi:hypothetical protein
MLLVFSLYFLSKAVYNEWLNGVDNDDDDDNLVLFICGYLTMLPVAQTLSVE